MTQRLGRFLQVRDPEGPDRLNDIRSYGTKWCIHPRVTFLAKNRFRQGTIRRKLA